MKVIDLLNKIANGEEVPKKIKYEEDIYIHIDNYCYYCEDTNLILSDRIFAEYSKLNEKIEIIEEDKKIEHIYYANLYTQDIHSLNEWVNEHFNEVYNKIYELIDEVNKLKDGNNEK